MSHAILQPLKFPVSAVPADFGKRIADERGLLKWSQAQLAQVAGLRRETISRLERGRCVPEADTVFRLEHALDLEPGTLVPEWPEWAPLNDTNLGPASRRRRRQLKLSLSVVAGKAGVSPATLSRFEREDGATPSLVRIERTELDTQFQFPAREELATALGFDSLAAYTRWCARHE